jgi:hypothetical protein
MHTLSTLVLLGAGVATIAQTDSLFVTMGGEKKVREWVDLGVDGHYPDDITRGWFDIPALDITENNTRILRPWNIYTDRQLKEHVYQFACTGTCGAGNDCGCDYKGRNMIDSHERMGKTKPLTNTTIQAAIWHFLSGMERTNAGGGADSRDSVHDTLWSVVPDVLHHSNVMHAPTEGESLYSRIGGEMTGRETRVQLLLEGISERHLTDGMTRAWYESIGKAKYLSITDDGVTVNQPNPKPLERSGFHALAYHVVREMAIRSAGGPREWDEMLGLIYRLKSSIVDGTDGPVTVTAAPTFSTSGASSTTVLAVAVVLLLAALL